MLDETAGRYEKALENYRRVQEREPRNTDALRRIAAVYNAMDMPDKAIASYKQAIALEPGLLRCRTRNWACSTTIAASTRKPPSSSATPSRALPGTVQAYINLGAVLSDLGRDAEAEAGAPGLAAHQGNRRRLQQPGRQSARIRDAMPRPWSSTGAPSR